MADEEPAGVWDKVPPRPRFGKEIRLEFRPRNAQGLGWIITEGGMKINAFGQDLKLAVNEKKLSERERAVLEKVKKYVNFLRQQIGLEEVPTGEMKVFVEPERVVASDSYECPGESWIRIQET